MNFFFQILKLFPPSFHRAYNRPKIKDLQQAPLTNATQQEIAEVIF